MRLGPGPRSSWLQAWLNPAPPESHQTSVALLPLLSLGFISGLHVKAPGCSKVAPHGGKVAAAAPDSPPLGLKFQRRGASLPPSVPRQSLFIVTGSCTHPLTHHCESRTLLMYSVHPQQSQDLFPGHSSRQANTTDIYCHHSIRTSGSVRTGNNNVASQVCVNLPCGLGSSRPEKFLW